MTPMDILGRVFCAQAMCGNILAVTTYQYTRSVQSAQLAFTPCNSIQQLQRLDTAYLINLPVSGNMCQGHLIPEIMIFHNPINTKCDLTDIHAY